MTPQEKKINEVEARVSNLETKFEMFMKSHEEFKQEILNRDNQRVEDIREIRTSLDGMNKHVQNLTVAAMVGIGTAVVGIGAIAVTVMYSVFSR